jgi:hypothetical protein
MARSYRIRRQRLWSTALRCFVTLRGWTKKDGAALIARLDEEYNTRPLTKTEREQLELRP